MLLGYTGNRKKDVKPIRSYPSLSLVLFFFQDPTSDMAIVARKGSHVVRVHREQKERRKAYKKLSLSKSCIIFFPGPYIIHGYSC